MRRTLGFAVLLAGAACKSSTPPPAEETPQQKLMKAHADEGALMREAVINADLRVVRDHANKILAQLDDPSSPTEWGKYKAELKDAAEQAAFTVDIDRAAPAIAKLAAECGKCHADHAQGPEPAIPAAPADDGSLKGRMARHRWAVGRLWDGLVAPSDASWKSGIGVFAVPPVEIDKIAVAGTEGDVERLAGEVRALGEREATNQTQRAEIMGELLTRCGSCHSMFGKGHR